MTYVIHGATGAQGAPVVAALAAAGKPVVAISRNADAALGGVRVVAADNSSADQLTAAYRGATGVFVHLPLGADEDRLTYARNIVAALGEARPARVVFSTSGVVVDDPTNVLTAPTGSAVATLVDGLASSGLSHAVIVPRLFLENLLLPPVVDAVRAEGVLRYPLRTDFPVAWASHLDIADVAAALFEQTDVTGTVAVGQDPAVVGPELAEAFSARLGKSVIYEAKTPVAFGEILTPLFGAGAAAGIAGLYTALGTQHDNVIVPERSAQKLLGITPRTTSRWLADIGF